MGLHSQHGCNSASEDLTVGLGEPEECNLEQDIRTI